MSKSTPTPPRELKVEYTDASGSWSLTLGNDGYFYTQRQGSSSPSRGVHPSAHLTTRIRFLAAAVNQSTKQGDNPAKQPLLAGFRASALAALSLIPEAGLEETRAALRLADGATTRLSLVNSLLDDANVKRAELGLEPLTKGLE